ncbi:MAG TPA: hypothetical protein VER17_09840 [Tepidisphaeraceae bacterium]|nr:hypothetical protein [Tepidisphaeraceae bacterium]
MSRTTAAAAAGERARASGGGDELPLSADGRAWTAPRIARWVAAAWTALLLLGMVALWLPGATIRGNELSIERAVFTAVNAATLTGFQQAVPLDQLGALGQAVVLALVVVGTLSTLLIGGLALNRAIRLPYTDLQIVRATLFTYVFSLGIGTSLLLDPTRGLIAAASQAASAFGNSGLFLGTLPAITDWRTHAALMPLAVVGAMSVPLLLEVSDLLFRRQALSPHARVTIALLAGVYLFGLIVLAPWGLRGANGGLNLSGALATGSALSIDGRTAGLPLHAPAAMTRAAQWLLIALMLIGAAPGGTAGGVKVTALFHAWRGTRRALRREAGLRVTGIAATWILGYALLVFATVLGLLATLPEMAADRLLMLAASSVSNTGLSHEPVTLTGGGLAVLTAAMALGRAAPLLVLWWLASTTEDADVAVG